MDAKYDSQLQKVYHYWKSTIASRYMIAIATDIPIQNICRHVEILKTTGQIAIVSKDYCAITGELVEFLSTDENNFPPDNQLKLCFD